MTRAQDGGRQVVAAADRAALARYGAGNRIVAPLGEEVSLGLVLLFTSGSLHASCQTAADAALALLCFVAARVLRATC